MASKKTEPDSQIHDTLSPDEIHERKILAHAMRFALLGGNQEDIAEFFGMNDSRNFRYLKDGTSAKGFSQALKESVSIMLLVHRPSPVPLFKIDESEPNTLLVKWKRALQYMVERARTVDDLKAIDDMLLYLGTEESKDYQILGLSAAISFAIWKLRSDLKKGKYAPFEYLQRAIARWDKAADLVPRSDEMGPTRETFNINALSARIHQETFSKANSDKRQRPSEVHYKAYRKYADMVKSIPARRDSLEQSCLLNDDSLIDENFRLLLKATKNITLHLRGRVKKITALKPLDEEEVLLYELEHNMDGFSALERQPVFQEWKIKILSKPYYKEAI